MKIILSFLIVLFLNIAPAYAEEDVCNLNMESKTVQGQYDIAYAYEMGHCLEQDKIKAVEIYTNISNAGYAPAQFRLGELNFSGYFPNFQSSQDERIMPNYIQAKNWYLKAAEQGHSEAQLRLGFLFAEKHFEGLTTDLDEAEKWFIKAAENDANKAGFRLGNFYQHYRKPPQYDKAFEWLKKSAEAGNRVAQFDLAAFYLGEKGSVEKDTTEWLNWTLKAAEQNNLHAMIALSKAYKAGAHDLRIDNQSSVAWAMRVAERNKSIQWINRIADAFYEGEGNLPQNLPQAAEWYAKAAKKGDKHAANRLSRISSKRR